MKKRIKDAVIQILQFSINVYIVLILLILGIVFIYYIVNIAELLH